jgi:hypothetical protein
MSTAGTATAGTATARTAQVRRSHDRSDRRKPLRLQITRRRAPRRAGGEKFVTQVRFGGAEAVVVPWRDGLTPVLPE